MKPVIVDGNAIAIISDDGRYITLCSDADHFTVVGILWSMMVVSVTHETWRTTEHIARSSFADGSNCTIVADPKAGQVTFKRAGMTVLSLSVNDVVAIEAQRKATTDEFRKQRALAV